MTSLAKAWVVVSLTRSSPRRGRAAAWRGRKAALMAMILSRKAADAARCRYSRRRWRLSGAILQSVRLSRPAAKSRISGSWPVARMKARRSRLASVVVAVLTSGWQLTVSCGHQAGVEDHADARGGRSLIRPNGVTEPGGTPSVSMRSSGLPKESRPEAPMRLCRCLQVDRRLLAGDDQKERVLLVLEEEVLGVGARRSRRGAPAPPRR